MAIGSIHEALARAGVTNSTLSGDQAAALDGDGYAVFRHAIPPDWLEPLCEAFEHSVLPSERWPAPREHHTRHAMVDNDELVRRVCLLPVVLAAAYHLLRTRFFLTTVQGRDPRPDGGYQLLHRDWTEIDTPAPFALMLAFIDPFGPGNGATRVVPGTHLQSGGPDEFSSFGTAHPEQVVLEGEAGDILVCNGRLAHSATRNTSGATRRSFLASFADISQLAIHRETRDLTGASADVRYLLGEEAMQDA
jgi:hypothetical protein